MRVNETIMKGVGCIIMIVFAGILFVSLVPNQGKLPGRDPQRESIDNQMKLSFLSKLGLRGNSRPSLNETQAQTRSDPILSSFSESTTNESFIEDSEKTVTLQANPKKEELLSDLGFNSDRHESIHMKHKGEVQRSDKSTSTTSEIFPHKSMTSTKSESTSSFNSQLSYIEPSRSKPVPDDYYKLYADDVLASLQGPFLDISLNVRELIINNNALASGVNKTSTNPTQGGDGYTFKGVWTPSDPYNSLIGRKSGYNFLFTTPDMPWKMDALHEISPSTSDLISALPPLDITDSSTALLDETRKLYKSPSHDTLIVFTTCNQLSYTVRALEYIKLSLNMADLIVVDDHSIDGTVAYLTKKGYFVIGKDAAKGLTDSWNTGFQLAVEMGYKYIFFVNNDVLVPRGSLDIMRAMLENEAVVVPLTSTRGAGHNPIQSISTIYNISETAEDYILNPRNAQKIQTALISKCLGDASKAMPFDINSNSNSNNNNKNASTGQTTMDGMKGMGKELAQHWIVSTYKNMPRFNGFAFGVSVSRIASAAFEYPVKLFDSKLTMVGQEDALVDSMMRLNLPIPKVSICSFLFHFKSITVSSASKSPRHEGSPKDKRDDLLYYHPELAGNAAQTSSPASVDPNVTVNNEISTATNRLVSKKLSILQTLSSSSTSSSRTMSKEGRAMTGNDPKTFPFLYFDYKTVAQLPKMSVYPPASQESMLARDNNASTTSAPEEQAWRNTVLETTYVIAFATSNPMTNPSAGDVFTAYELASALESQFKNVKVRYLRRGADWYDGALLSDVDVVITMLDQYDVGKALFSKDLYAKQQLTTISEPNKSNGNKHFTIPTGNAKCAKPSIVFVAWMRNWFQRWLTRPWLGNYDLLLVSSQAAKTFFEDYGRSVGFRVQCVVGCPTFNFPALSSSSMPMSSVSISNNNTSTVSSASSTTPPISVSLPPTRRIVTGARTNVHVDLLRIGTNEKRFCPGKRGPNKFQGDFAFTGSYYNVSREVMRLDMSSLPYKGVVVGKDWEKAPGLSKEWLDMVVGSVPYAMMPQIYRSVKVVIDDANHVTEPWGSVNSRVFDALAAGVLVVTNGALGAYEVFQSRLPTYSNPKELAQILEYYLENREARRKLTQQLHDDVVAQHTYSVRAREFASILHSLDIHLIEIEADKKEGDNADVNDVQRSKGGGGQDVGEKSNTSQSGNDATTIASTNDSSEAKAKSSMIGSDSSESTPTTTDRASSARKTQSTSSLEEKAKAKAKTNAKTTSSINTGSPKQTPWLSSRSLAMLHKHGHINGTNMENASSTVPLHVRSNPTTSLPPKAAVCVGIRTFDKQAPWLEILIRSMAAQHLRSPQWSQLNLKFFITLTETPTPEFSNAVFSIIDRTNRDLGSEQAYLVWDASAPARQFNNYFYGYDSTDELAEYLLTREECANGWILFTNGDNIYNSAWFDTVSMHAIDPSVEMIAWDFVTHHLRPQGHPPHLQQLREQTITVSLKRQYIDLGSMMLRGSVYLRKKLSFLPDSIFTKELFARDYFIVDAATSDMRPSAIRLIHRCLMFHQ